MINLEYYKDEVAEVFRTDLPCNHIEEIDKYGNCEKCPFNKKGANENLYYCDYHKFIDWLLEENKEPIKLTKFEYDLLESYINKGYYFYNFSELKEMRNKGYFKGIKDTSMMIEEILDNCEVINDE